MSSFPISFPIPFFMRSCQWIFPSSSQPGRREDGPTGVHVVAQGTGGGGDCFFVLFLPASFILPCSCAIIFLLQCHLLWMLPMEVWQEVLGFCPCKEYTRMATGKPASREFYFLLKQSLLELRFGRILPSPALGGLWIASRDALASHTRVLHLGLCSLRFSPLSLCA